MPPNFYGLVFCLFACYFFPFVLFLCKTRLIIERTVSGSSLSGFKILVVFASRHTLALPLGNLAQCIKPYVLCQACLHDRQYPVPLRDKSHLLPLSSFLPFLSGGSFLSLSFSISSPLCISLRGFSVALEPVLELAIVDQADFKLTEIHLPLSPKCWD